MSHIVVMITTYNRPVRLGWLLDDLTRWGRDHHLEVFVWDDASETAPVGQRPHVHYRRSDTHRGKIGYWETCTKLYGWMASTLEQRDELADYYCQLPDDVRLEPDFFQRMIAHWEAIQDQWKICLNPLLDRERISNPSWTGNIGEYVRFGPYRFRNAPWNDGCWFGTHRFLDQLGYGFTPINPRRWERHPGLGSGVGPQLTHRLLDKRFTFYHMADYPLVRHGAHTSLMHPGRVSAGKTTTTERVIGGMATYKHPVRQRTVQQAVASILDQVHELHIYCNGYAAADIPSAWQIDRRITVYRSDEHMGDLADLGKFFPLTDATVEGYYLSFDDDIVYPPTYVAAMLQELEYYGCAAIVGYHGASLKAWPAPMFYRNRQVWHNQSALEADRAVHILGTGCLAFHTRTFRPQVTADMPLYMADIHIARAAQVAQVPMICLAHERQSLKILDVPDTIYDRYSGPGKDVTQADVMNAAPWALCPLPPKLTE